MRITVSNTASLEDHVRAIDEMVEASINDPECRRLAVALAAGSYDWAPDPRSGQQIPVVKYHGRYYRVAPGNKTPNVCQARDTTCEITSVWNFLVLNVRYTGDTDGYDVYQDLKTTLESGGADCDDATIAFGALLRCLGYPMAMRIISQDGRSWSHVYPMVQVDRNAWLPLDMTENGKLPGWEFPRIAAKRDFAMGAGV